MLTHYVKTRPKVRYDGDAGERLNSTESLLYLVAPDDSLSTARGLENYYLQEIDAKPQEYRCYPKNKAAIAAAIDRLVKDGYLKEVHASRLTNWLKTF